MKESLETLNAIERGKHLGGVILVSILMAVGILGNIHVLYAYTFKTIDSTRRTCILVLGILDLIASAVGMPCIVVDLRNPLTFDLTTGCKILRFVNYFVSVSSIFILLVIAIDRYRKVCHPLAWQISKTTAKFVCLGFILLSGTLSWPATLLYGSSDIKTSNPNVTGVSCLIKKEYATTRYPIMFNAVLLCIVLIISSCLIVLYCLIGKTIVNFRSPNVRIQHDQDSKSIETIQKHFGKSVRESPSCSNDAHSTSKTSYEDNEIEIDNIEPKMAKHHVTETDPLPSSEIDRNCESPMKRKTGKNVVTKDDHVKGDTNARKFAIKHRTTLMFCMITMVFMLSYFPHLILMILFVTKPGFLESMSYTGLLVYNTVIWCFYINNVVNAIIYWYFDKKFRNDIKVCYWHLVCGCCNVCRQNIS